MSEAKIRLGQVTTLETQLNTIYGQANSAYTAANGSQNSSNTVYADANTANTTAKNAYAQANLAYTAANSAQTYANTLSTSVNSTVATINTNYQAAYAAANTGATNALNAYAQANSAYTTANNALPKAGGTMTGNLIMSAATVNTSIANISTVITGNALSIGTGIGSNSNVTISANGTEYLRLTNTGNVGIGTATPSYKFHLSGGQYYIAPSGINTSYTGDGLWGSPATPCLLGSAAYPGSYSKFAAPGMIIGYQDNGNGLYSPAYGFEVKSIDGRPVGGISVKAIVLKDIDTNTLVFYVNTTGNVLNVNNSYGSASDVSIKENITDASSKLNDLLNVRVRNYNLKADPNKLKQLGVIAQELETVFPGIVETDTEGLKSVKYSIFVPMLIKAIQEQQVLIQDQKVLIQSLTTRLTAVEAR